MRAMILAAGRGKRMRPLSDHTPKPLLKVNGIPLIVHHIHNLRRAGFVEIMINLGHLGEQIEATLKDGKEYHVQLHYSYEEPVLETGGGIANVLPWLQEEATHDQPFLVVSGDIFTDYPFERLRHLALKGSHSSSLVPLAHLVLVDNPDHHPIGDYALHENGRVSEVGSPLYNFAGIGVYRAQLFKDCPKGSFRLPELFKKAFSSDTITGEYYHGQWFNLGTPEQLQWLNDHLRAKEGI